MNDYLNRPEVEGWVRLCEIHYGWHWQRPISNKDKMRQLRHKLKELYPNELGSTIKLMRRSKTVFVMVLWSAQERFDVETIKKKLK